ncbi:general secretion pathway protein E [Desulfonatronum thiosulfatophilum]|uniref:General secretion pathway protein E n=1 Tax=Desulfonatronum thiosulfatophilum TaxID=617002 RepID=A0A1G6E992_9BACT|nr:GspE/PulE family protein [Desulfonatronum thiosulfatophilum]SDB53963.1 general secretion pathway protein E [Desulfonatronum thiosulfatophilum]
MNGPAAVSAPDLSRLPADLVQEYLAFPRRNEFLPVAVENGNVLVWLRTAKARPLADFLAWKAGLKIRTELVSSEVFFPALEQALTLWEEDNPAEEDAGNDELEASGQELLGWSHEDAPIVRLVNRMLHQAVSQGASDIHFEGRENGFQVRFRVDGQLRMERRLDLAVQSTVLARIKVMGQMDVAESRAPQDGRFQVRVGRKDVDVRVSTMPTLNGEKAVLRILDRSKNILPLSDLGLEPEAVAAITRMITAPHGIILVTGPTGSGKTTTLYAALKELIRDSRNIMTVEDPVEYHLPGVNQVQVNRAAGVTFATAIRGFLRQDPDIILVGEIRDQETAGTAVQASLTGHLVLATLHTNDAPTAVTRLLEMGVEPFLLASSLHLVIGQRLVRLNCPLCSAPVNGGDLESACTPKFFEAAEVNANGANGNPLSSTRLRGSGCDACRQSGYRGRQGVFELMPVDEALRSLIVQKASVEQLRQRLRAQGFQTMHDHGSRLVAAGKTTQEELLRVTSL